MRFSLASTLVALLAADAAVASSWFSKAVYNKWHETELERWLSDNNVPYPTPADRKDLENLVKSNWQANVETPYNNWDVNQLNKYLNDRGVEVKKGTAKSKDQLAAQVKSNWAYAEGAATNAYTDIKDWLFSSWTESSLKSFADKHSIPVPQPRTRDTLLKTVRENYQTVANKVGETAAYPGNWIYASWSDSELKAWLDEHGIPVPQPSKRDSLIASVRRNAYTASTEAAAQRERLSNAIFDSWSDSEIKAWADKNGIKVPQGSNRNELLAVARKNAAKLTGDNLSASASKLASSASKSASSAASIGSKSATSAYSVGSKSATSAYSVGSKSAVSAYGAATSSAGNEYARATDAASGQGAILYSKASSVFVSIINEVQIAVGLKTNYLSSASKSVASASAKASAKMEL